MSLSLCWFRTDLRVHDNLALAAAAARGPVVALYIATPGQWRAHDDAPVKLDFWRRNLEALAAKLASLGVPLVTCEVADYNGVPDVIMEVIDKWDIGLLAFNAEYPLNESRRDAAVTAACESRGVDVQAFHDSVLIKPGGILNTSGGPFRVFTPFSRQARQIIGSMDLTPAGLPESLASPRQLAPLSFQKAPADLDWPQAASTWADIWPAGEGEARGRLEAFCRERIGQYRDARDFPAVDGTSVLSPWLNAGVLSIRECWRLASAWQAGDGVDTWKSELLWREFYRHIMFHTPRISMHRPFREELDDMPWRDDDAGFAAWCAGRTGIPLVDAAMRQLKESGWMHNRLRMITAMFLSKHLLIDWRKGEQWFMRHLVDGDFAANNGGWQWSASTGTDAVPYFRVFNPVAQSRRFDPGGDFIRRFLPELADLDDKAIHDPGLLRPDTYPTPIVDLKFGRERAIAAFKG